MRLPGPRNEDCYVEIACTDPGLAGVWAQLHATDGAALERKLDALAATVCPLDPRTKAQRRADALGALAFGAEVLSCQCDGPDCAAAQRDSGANVVIHLLAEQAAVNGDSQTPGYLAGYGPLPAALLRDVAGHAKLKPSVHPASRSGARVSAVIGAGGIRPIPGFDLSFPRLRRVG